MRNRNVSPGRTYRRSSVAALIGLLILGVSFGIAILAKIPDGDLFAGTMAGAGAIGALMAAFEAADATESANHIAVLSQTEKLLLEMTATNPDSDSYMGIKLKVTNYGSVQAVFDRLVFRLYGPGQPEGSTVITTTRVRHRVLLVRPSATKKVETEVIIVGLDPETMFAVGLELTTFTGTKFAGHLFVAMEQPSLFNDKKTFTCSDFFQSETGQLPITLSKPKVSMRLVGLLGD